MQIVTDERQKEMKEHGTYSYPLLISREKLSRYETGSFLWHWHPAIELTYITKGEMVYKVNHHEFLLREGDALFGNSSTLHAGCMFHNQDCEYTSITFDPKLIYGYENSLIYTKFVKPIVQNGSLTAAHFNKTQGWHEEILSILQTIIQIEQEKHDAYELDLLTQLNTFWKQLFINHENLLDNFIYESRQYERIRSILTFIEHNYSSKITLEDIADCIHVCKEECSRIFKKHMNLTPFEFLLQYRIEKSIDYLIHTKYSINTIAESVGFHDSNYFTKVFRKQKGCSPTKYRQFISTK